MKVGSLNAFQEALASRSLVDLREAGYFISRLSDKHKDSDDRILLDGFKRRWGELLDAYIAIKPSLLDEHDRETAEREIEHLIVLSGRS